MLPLKTHGNHLKLTHYLHIAYLDILEVFWKHWGIFENFPLEQIMSETGRVSSNINLMHNHQTSTKFNQTSPVFILYSELIISVGLAV
jgi:hypothetical protein